MISHGCNQWVIWVGTRCNAIFCQFSAVLYRQWPIDYWELLHVDRVFLFQLVWQLDVLLITQVTLLSILKLCIASSIVIWVRQTYRWNKRWKTEVREKKKRAVNHQSWFVPQAVQNQFVSYLSLCQLSKRATWSATTWQMTVAFLHSALCLVDFCAIQSWNLFSQAVGWQKTSVQRWLAVAGSEPRFVTSTLKSWI